MTKTKKETKFTTLYKRDNVGKIQQWDIEVEDNKYRSISGGVGEKLTTNEWTVCEGKNLDKKNATTGQEQALKEAKAKHKKKTEEGYTPDKNNVDQAAVFGVMLAEKYEDYQEDIVYPVYSQPKLDGIRARIDRVGVWSRNNKPITSCPHIFEQAQKVLKHLPADVCLDGELYNHELKANFNRICELVKKQKPDAARLKEAEELIEYWCYDITSPEKFSTRYDTIIEATAGAKHFVIVRADRVDDKAKLDKLYEGYIEDGYEGQMVRIDMAYQHKRSKYLLKRKEFQDAEWGIREVFEGVGVRTGTAGYITLLNKDGTPFLNANGDPVKSNIKGSFDWLRKLWEEREELVGKQATIKFFNLTPDGIPRFPYVIKIRDYE